MEKGKVDLPEGWKPGYGGLIADTGMDDHVYTKGKRMVRFDYRVGAFKAFAYVEDSNYARSFADWNKPPGVWVVCKDCPAFDDPVACIVWLEVQGG